MLASNFFYCLIIEGKESVAEAFCSVKELS